MSGKECGEEFVKMPEWCRVVTGEYKTGNDEIDELE